MKTIRHLIVPKNKTFLKVIKITISVINVIALEFFFDFLKILFKTFAKEILGKRT